MTSEPRSRDRPGESAPRQPVEWVTVRRCETVEEAHVLRGALEAEGIPVVIANQAMSRLIGASTMWATEVMVPTSMEGEARRVLGA